MTNLIIGRDVTLLAIFTDLLAETQRKEPPGIATGVSNEVAIVFLVVLAIVVIAVVLLIAFVYHKNKPALCSGAEQL